MADPGRVLVIDDDRAVRAGLASALDEQGYVVVAAQGAEAARRAIGASGFDCVLLDIHLRDADGLSLLAELRAALPKLPVIMATAYGDSERTIAAMKAGAFDYITKPFDFDALLDAVARAVQRPLTAPSHGRTPEATLVGTSPAMLTVWKAIGRAANCDAPVLITGESGTGKDLVARAIHAHSARLSAPFVPVNIAALPSGLVESELFGHERGAFTGASAAREGRFELASEGTLFLDEVGDLEPAMQTRLLRVLEDGGFERVGGNTQRTSRARILAATSRPVAPGAVGTTLRVDLFYRLSVVRIEVPPLRARRSDIPLLVDVCLQRIGGPRRAISARALEALVDADWPGNVRQLLHVIEAACVMSGAEVLDLADFDLPRLTAPPEHTGDVDDELNLRRNLEAVERSLIRRALKASRGNRSEAARRLGIRRALLYDRIRQLSIDDQ